MYNENTRSLQLRQTTANRMHWFVTSRVDRGAPEGNTAANRRAPPRSLRTHSSSLIPASRRSGVVEKFAALQHGQDARNFDSTFARRRKVLFGFYGWWKRAVLFLIKFKWAYEHRRTWSGVRVWFVCSFAVINCGLNSTPMHVLLLFILIRVCVCCTYM